MYLLYSLSLILSGFIPIHVNSTHYCKHAMTSLCRRHTDTLYCKTCIWSKIGHQQLWMQQSNWINELLHLRPTCCVMDGPAQSFYMVSTTLQDKNIDGLNLATWFRANLNIFNSLNFWNMYAHVNMLSLQTWWLHRNEQNLKFNKYVH